MHLKELTYDEIKSIYNERMVDDFPDDELKPFFIIEQHIKDGIYDCYGLCEDNQIYAYAYCLRVPYKNSNVYLIDYLAVKKNYRSRGYGSELIKLLKLELKNKALVVLVEVENPDYAAPEKREECLRRLSYYIRNGIVDTGASEYLYHVEYKLLEMLFDTNPPKPKQEIFDLIDVVYSTIFPEEIYKNQLSYHKEN
ncbi:MAG: GNAT family N-acetyltransferase [Saccharofermentans sp.]|nr:GNAT family N-acetyltransferase [Saccharofermentans sp.]